MDAPEYWRVAVGGMPKYFVHLQRGNRHCFGLSKFCALKGIELVDYVRERIGHGHVAQEHIHSVTGQKWIHLSRVPAPVRIGFLKWFHGFFPSSYDQRNISIITIGRVSSVPRSPKKMSPEDLADRLREQAVTGRIGERVAMRHEKARLLKTGVENTAQCVQHVALLNAAAGFDIFSESRRTGRRFIEVKSSRSGHGAIYMTRHEVEVLRKHGREAYLYLVAVEGKDGRVVREIPDPIRHIESKGRLEPVAFQVEFSPRLPRSL